MSVRERGAWQRLVSVALLAAGLGACGGAASDVSISSAPLSGMIAGKPWTFVAGQTDFFLSSNGDKFFATLFDQPFTSPCVELEPPGADHHLILNIPKAVGHYTISLSLNQTFSYLDAMGTSQNDIATSGALEVNTLTATSLQGGVKMAFRANDSVDGQFEITVCTQ